MPRSIRHITLTTGHARDILPGEVSDEAIAVCRELLERATSGDIAEAVPIPGLPGYSMTARAGGKCLSAVVYVDGPPSIPLVTIGIAAHSRCGASLWRVLHHYGSVPVVTDPEACPPEPWVAAALDEAALDGRHRPALHVIGDLERCLAWAWIDG